jgi:hypothetical protein
MSANVYANNRGLGVLQFQVMLKKLIILVLMTSLRSLIPPSALSKR